MDEYISREAVMSKCDDIWNNADETTDAGVATINAIDRITDFIEAMPAADVQSVKHGRWIEQKHTPTNGYNYNVPYSTYICSSCGLEIHNDEYSKYVRGTYTNCPVCTAKMDGGAEERCRGKVNERNIEVSKPDGNCLACKFQYLEDSDYWCSICPGNPQDI